MTLPVAAALLVFASKDSTRPHLGIGIEGPFLCATDGYRAVQFPLPEGRYPDRAVWSHAQLETAIKVARATKQASVALVFAERQSEREFPPLRHVIPEDGVDLRKPIGLNPSYLGDIAKVCKACGVEVASLTSANGELDPVAFSVGNAPGLTAKAVIMPMRI